MTKINTSIQHRSKCILLQFLLLGKNVTKQALSLAGIIIATISSIVITAALGVAFVVFYNIHWKRKRNNRDQNKNESDVDKNNSNNISVTEGQDRKVHNPGEEDVEIMSNGRNSNSQSFDICREFDHSPTGDDDDDDDDDDGDDDDDKDSDGEEGKDGFKGLNAAHLQRLNSIFAANLQNNNETEEAEL